MQTVQTIQQARKAVSEARRRGEKIGLVPTMGALHAGHLSLIRAAAEQTDFVVVSIFVNPTQFGPGEDLDAYPRDLPGDIEICRQNGAHLVFAPSVDEMYPRPNLTWVNVEKLTDPLCGRHRPGHFRGVTTVCTKLFNILQPDLAFFGRKDAQQAVVIKRMVRDLNMPLKIVVCPTIRENDGLAVSSRNKYLNDSQRTDAALLYKSLRRCRELIDRGERLSKNLITEMKKLLNSCDALKIEYIEILNADTLEPLDRVTGRVLIAVAACLGPARLIDNIVVDVSK